MPATAGFILWPVCSQLVQGEGSATHDRPRSASVPLSRRDALRFATAVSVAAVASVCHAARADLLLGKPSTSELLHRMEHPRSEEEVAAAKAARDQAREARRAQQLRLQQEAEQRRAQPSDASIADGRVGENESSNENNTHGKIDDIEANLRANYYYPTARKRYLPRIRRAFEDLQHAKDSVSNGQWETLASYVRGGSLDDCVLPMRLYASSLNGQGLSLAARFVQDMTRQSDRFDVALKNLRDAINKRDSSLAITAINDMESSIQKFRTAGKLEAPDFGVGEVPKEERIGSGLGNNNPALYNRNFAVQGIGK